MHYWFDYVEREEAVTSLLYLYVPDYLNEPVQQFVIMQAISKFSFKTWLEQRLKLDAVVLKHSVW